MVEYARKKREKMRENSTDTGVLFASGLIAGEGLTGIGIAVTAVIMGQKPPGIGFSFTGGTGALVSLLAFTAVGYLLYRGAAKPEPGGNLSSD